MATPNYSDLKEPAEQLRKLLEAQAEAGATVASPEGWQPFEVLATKAIFNANRFAELGGGAAVAWGEVTGTIGDQSDLSSALAAKAPLASPALTGNPTAPTQSVGDDSTRIATTAFVKDAIDDAGVGGGGTWGSITGTLSNQTDLQSALDAKVSSSAIDTVSERTALGIKSTIGGSPESLQDHGNSGATETFDLATANVHTVTLDSNCTFTLSGFTNGAYCSGLIRITQDGTGSRVVTWPGAVVSSPAINGTAGAITWVSFWSMDGGTTIYAASDSLQLPSIELGHASDTTITRTSAGDISVEGNRVFRVGGSFVGLPETWVIPIGDETTEITTGTAKVTFRAPYAATVTAVRASLTTASSSGAPTFDINESGTTILSTKLTIDASEKTSTTAATAAVISDAAIADDAEITIDVDAAGTDAAGAKITIYVTRA